MGTSEHARIVSEVSRRGVEVYRAKGTGTGALDKGQSCPMLNLGNDQEMT